MTVSTTVFFTDWSAANGVNKDWSYDFNIGDETEVQVLVRDGTDDTTIQVFVDNFQLNKIGDGDEGFVTYPVADSALAAGKQVRVRRIVQLVQTTEIGNEGDFRPQLHERTFDKLVKMIQQVNGSISSSIIVIGNNPGYSMGSVLNEGSVLIYKDGLIQSGPAGSDIEDAQGYALEAGAARDLAQKWAENPEDVTVDGVGTYSALHYAAKAEASSETADEFADKASKWAENPEDDPVETGPNQFSALHWANKAEAAKDDIDEILSYSRMPVGTIHWYLGTTAPSGSLVLDGSEITDLYPDLKAMIVAIGSPWGTSAGGNPYLPDLITNGEFIRAGGPGGLAIGTMQLDQIQNITGSIGQSFAGLNAIDAASTNGVFAPSDPASRNVAQANASTIVASRTATFDASRVARAGVETRPRAIAFLPCIKAFGTVAPEGMADLSELLTAIADQPTAEAGSDNTKLMTPQNTWWQGAARDARVLHVRDQKASGTAGGAAGSTSVQRVLNTVLVNNITGASLASNDVTLPAGTYEADFSATQFVGAGTRLYLQTAAGTKLGASLNSYPSTSDNVHTTLRGNCRFTLAAATAVRLQHFIANNTGGSGNNLGLAVSDGNPEIYAELVIRKVD